VILEQLEPLAAKGVEFMEGLASDTITEEKFEIWLAQASTQIISYQSFKLSDKLNMCVIKIINNLLNTFDSYTKKYRILLIFFNKVTS
jgi:hypothetical protein